MDILVAGFVKKAGQQEVERMAIALGIDTGGTYTDAVLIRDERDVLATAKALTTRHDLAIGIGRAVEAVLASSATNAGDIAIASLSTTLATNALVEGQGGRIALVCAGFSEDDLDRHGLRAALKGDPVWFSEGGHDHAGVAAANWDEPAISAFVDSIFVSVTGFAVAGRFATRNPEHELEIAGLIRERTGLPVTCSHQLSARLNGPKRAVTAVLNARLVGMIGDLINRAEDELRVQGIFAPLMVVRGDGALMSAEQARLRPIETILSGPAASLVGARWLTGIDSALVSDIGGTTTDVALMREGKPAIDPNGAYVGGFRTMVEAVAMRTSGLGGDSEVHVNMSGLQGGLKLGPKRAIPIALLAQEQGNTVRDALEVQLNTTRPGEHDGLFVRVIKGVNLEGLDSREKSLTSRIGDDVLPMGAAVRTRLEIAALSRLRDRGIVQIAAATPSDAAHVLGHLSSWDADAATMALELLSRRRVGTGDRVASGAKEMASAIVEQLTNQTVLALLEAGFSEDDAFSDDPETLARHILTTRGICNHAGVLNVNVGLNLPVIGLGASAPTYYPAVGRCLGTQMVLPSHAGVANAIGAVAGRITVRRAGTVTAPTEGRYRVHLDDGPQDLTNMEDAIAVLETRLRDVTLRMARDAGADDVEQFVNRKVHMARAEARDVFVEAEVTVEASGRPRMAQG